MKFNCPSLNQGEITLDSTDFKNNMYLSQDLLIAFNKCLTLTAKGFEFKTEYEAGIGFKSLVFANLSHFDAMEQRLK